MQRRNLKTTTCAALLLDPYGVRWMALARDGRNPPGTPTKDLAAEINEVLEKELQTQ